MYRRKSPVRKRRKKRPDPPVSAPVPVDTSQWSQASRRSMTCEPIGDHYSDRTLSCRNCRNAFVFSAQQQRETYEVRKAYIAQQRCLCPQCWPQRLQLVGELKRLRSRWASDRAGVKRDPQALRRWRELLAQAPRYGLRRDRAQCAMVDRLLAAALPPVDA